MKITILVDDENSWFVPYAKKLKRILIEDGKETELVFNQSDANSSDICFLLSCSKLVNKDFLDKNIHNIVVHASDLPKGKGFSPLAWQILEGKNEITLTLFEVVEEMDAGPYYMKDTILFSGTELLNTLRNKMAEKILNMCITFAAHTKYYTAKAQSGESTFYPRRRKKDDELDINKTIKEQFNHLRIADNERHPLWFQIEDKKYFIKIYDDSLYRQ